jgi:hypothetical protein
MALPQLHCQATECLRHASLARPLRAPPPALPTLPSPRLPHRPAQLYGSLVGMFELNNLGLSVPSPVEDYFLLVDGWREGEERQALKAATDPLLDALDTAYDTPCEGGLRAAGWQDAGGGCQAAVAGHGQGAGAGRGRWGCSPVWGGRAPQLLRGACAARRHGVLCAAVVRQPQLRARSRR